MSDDLNQTMEALMMAGITPATKRAHIRDLRYFEIWSEFVAGTPFRMPVPTEQVLKFIVQHAQSTESAKVRALVRSGARRKAGPLAVCTIRRMLGSLSQAHDIRGYPNPTGHRQVRTLLKRLKAAEPPRPKKKAITLKELEAMLATCCDGTLRSARDRALILVGFGSGGRCCSELVALRVEDLERREAGFLLHLRRSKTDVEGQGRWVPLAPYPSTALETWLTAAGITEGALFRQIHASGRVLGPLTGDGVLQIVQRRAALAGLDPSRYGAHSLRSGFMTQSDHSGVSLAQAMALSGHRSVSVAASYFRQGDLFDNPATYLVESFRGVDRRADPNRAPDTEAPRHHRRIPCRPPGKGKPED